MSLHITNGDSAGDLMRLAGLPGEVLPWRDVLHEGPVPAEMSLEDLSGVRARFGASQGWGKHAEILSAFRIRDARLAAFHDFEEVILWFEHDLYDQLQIIQLLDWFSGQELGATRLSMICIGDFPGVRDFHGLGNLTPQQLATLYGSQKDLSAEQLRLGRRAWRAFTAPDPAQVQRVLGEDLAPLPFLAPALMRYLEEFPGLETGLNRTQRLILELVAGGVRVPPAIFACHQDREAAPFMGDSTFWNRIDGLCEGPHPFLSNPGTGVFEAALQKRLSDVRLALTSAGRAALSGEADWIVLNGIDEWCGGAHLVTGGHWRWDQAEQILVTARSG
ncbi:MAG: DUF1835 domain-containing protein [Gammaproteobacteria bacterium]|nr:DUF1835 domain-containing protein [Gammaproteobacteria bacterium]